MTFFNVGQKKCKFFHSFAFIKYVIFRPRSVKKSAVACNFLTQIKNFSFIISSFFLTSSYVNWDFFGMSGSI
jgi:hypothetical protein